MGAVQTSSPAQEFLWTSVMTYSGAEMQLCPIKVPVDGCLGEIPAVDTWANRPNFLQQPYDAGEQKWNVSKNPNFPQKAQPTETHTPRSLIMKDHKEIN